MLFLPYLAEDNNIRSYTFTPFYAFVAWCFNKHRTILPFRFYALAFVLPSKLSHVSFAQLGPRNLMITLNLSFFVIQPNQ